jgi:GT2 family glycosyltransferase/glycosyltransferase involved in cell wall biosynthesis
LRGASAPWFPVLEEADLRNYANRLVEAAPTADEAEENPNSLGLLAHPQLAPLFIQAPRRGVLSAWYGHIPFAYWIMSALRPRIFVELGTHNGVSYAAFCDAVSRSELDTRCFAVDTWKGDEHAGHYGEDVFTDLQTFHDARYAAFSEMIRATFDQARDYFEDGSIDLLHIDGCHSYEAVKHDFESWRPKLSSKAVVLFHDTNVRERHFGVWRLWAELQETHSAFEFLHGHGLGVLAFGAEVPGAVRALCDLADPTTIARVRERFAASGRRCSVEVEIAQLRQEIAVGDEARIELQTQLTRVSTDAFAQERAAEEARAELQAQTDRRESDTSALRRELTRISAVALARERAATETRGQLTAALAQERTTAGTRSQLDQALDRIEFLQTRAAQLEHQIESFQQSTTWRLTWPVRAVATRLPPPLRRMARRALKAAYWAATPTRIPARLRARNALLAGLASAEFPATSETDAGQTMLPPAPSSRFSLDRIPRLRGDCAAALEWYDPEAPEVSIVVLNWNRADMTLLCLQHLWQRTTGHHYEIIVVDNGSREEDAELLRTNATLARIIPLGTNRYFGEANNIGVEAARGRIICLLNNDAFVHEGWLAPLVRTLDENPRTGAVGPRFLYPDGSLQEAGAIVNPDGSVLQLGKGQVPDDPLYNFARPVDYVSAACVVMRRNEFLRVLGFDLTWDPAYYEDVDLCLKLRLIGLRVLYCPQSTVTHIESATSSDSSNGLNLHNSVPINRTKFTARWGEFLRTSGEKAPNLIPSTVEPVPPLTGRPRIMLFTPYNITPGGGERYFLTIAEAFRGVADVVLVTPHPFSRMRILTMGREFGLQLDHVEPLCVDEIHTHPPCDLAFVVGNAILPPVGRMAAHNIFICQFPFPIEDAAYANHVRPFWNDYDLLLSYSAFVRRHVQAMISSTGLPDRPVEILAPPVPLLPVGSCKRAQILHVGRFFTGGHCKRQDLLIEALRKLIEQGVEAELHLVGSLHPEPEHRAYYADLRERATGLPVHFHVNCSIETLRVLYAESRIYWHATGFGRDLETEPHTTEHFGISVVEAMSAGCIPIVFAAGAPVEVVDDGVTGFHFRTIDELCTRTRALLKDTPQEKLDALAEAAANAARAYDEASFKRAVRTLAARFVTFSAEAHTQSSLTDDAAAKLAWWKAAAMPLIAVSIP